MPRLYASVTSEAHSGFTLFVTSWLTIAIPNFTVRLLTPFAGENLSEWLIIIVFVMLIISSSPKSGSLIDYNLTVEYISSGNASKMIVVKRSSVTASPKSLSSSRR